MDEPFSTTSPQFHFFKKRFLMWAIFKAFIEFVTIMFLCFMFWVFGYESWDFSSPNQGLNLHCLHRKAKSSLLGCQGSPTPDPFSATVSSTDT